MGCQFITIRKEHTRCPPGYHWNEESNQCLDAQGNPPPTNTESPKTELTSTPEKRKERFSEGWDKVDFEGDKYAIPEEQKKKIKQNVAIIRRYISTLARDRKFGPVLLPVTASCIAYDFCSKKTNQYRAKAKTEQQKKYVEEHQKQLDDIYSRIPKFNPEDKSFSPKEFARKRAEFDEALYKEMTELKKLAQKEGKNSSEYARYLAYVNFFKERKSAQTKVRKRIEGSSRSVEDARSRFKPN